MSRSRSVNNILMRDDLNWTGRALVQLYIVEDTQLVVLERSNSGGEGSDLTLDAHRTQDHIAYKLRSNSVPRILDYIFQLCGAHRSS